MSETQLPEGWVWKKLGEVVKLSSEKYQPTGKEEFYVGLEHIEKGTGKISQTAGTEQIDTIKNKFYTGELLYGKLRPNLNKAVIAPREGVCSTDILVFRPTGQVEIQYLHLLMITRQFVNDASANTAGVNLPRVSTKYLENYLVPLPPLPVQQAIVARIEELFSELEAGVQELKTALARLKTYRQAVLHHYLSNPDWERVKLGEVADRIQIGPFGAQLHQHDYISGGIPVINPTHIKSGKIWPAEDLTTSITKYQELSNYYLEEGDTIMGRRGEMARCALVTKRQTGWLCGTGSLFVRPHRDLMDPKFLAFTLGSQQVKTYLEGEASGSTMSNLNLKILKGVPVCYPDLIIQTQVVAEIEARLSEADTMEATIRQELVRAENLRQSILKQAFEGKLITAPTDQVNAGDLPCIPVPAEPVYGGQGDQFTLF